MNIPLVYRCESMEHLQQSTFGSLASNQWLGLPWSAELDLTVCRLLLHRPLSLFVLESFCKRVYTYLILLLQIFFSQSCFFCCKSLPYCDCFAWHLFSHVMCIYHTYVLLYIFFHYIIMKIQQMYSCWYFSAGFVCILFFYICCTYYVSVYTVLWVVPECLNFLQD